MIVEDKPVNVSATVEPSGFVNVAEGAVAPGEVVIISTVKSLFECIAKGDSSVTNNESRSKGVSSTPPGSSVKVIFISGGVAEAILNVSVF